uniref:Uncharacterized protein n=1 Tax=Onchocerca volvulus TaxID=6282 RepID=A0A8R1XSN5_ONCVO
MYIKACNIWCCCRQRNIVEIVEYRITTIIFVFAFYNGKYCKADTYWKRIARGNLSPNEL